jgi:hypothetical protein
MTKVIGVFRDYTKTPERSVVLSTYPFVAPSLKKEYNCTPSFAPGFHGLVEGEQK